jgi:hypothetical protein
MSTGTIPDFRTKANNSDGGDFELPPAGVHPGILIGLVDLGTHSSTYNNEKKDRHKILLAWELTAEADSKGQNFLIIQDYTWSLHKKAGLRALVDGFRGKALGDNEEYDLAEMLGKPCMISLSEGVSGGGKRFMEVTSLSPPMRGLTVPPASHDIYAFLLGMINSTLDPIDIPAWMPRLYGRNVIDDIRASQEYAKLPNF